MPRSFLLRHLRPDPHLATLQICLAAAALDNFVVLLTHLHKSSDR